MFYSYTGGKHKNMFDRFPLKINALSFCCYLSKVLLQERDSGLCKSLWKKRKKNDTKDVRDIENNGYLDACLKRKKRWIKIALILLQKYFQVSRERDIFKEHSRIWIATIYIHQIFHTHAHLDLVVWHFSLWVYCLTLQYSIASMLSSFSPYL